MCLHFARRYTKFEANLLDSTSTGLWSHGTCSIEHVVGYFMIQTQAGYCPHSVRRSFASSESGHCRSALLRRCVRPRTARAKTNARLIRLAETEQLSIGIQILAAGAGRLEALQTSAEPIAPLELNSLAVDFYSLRARIVRPSCRFSELIWLTSKQASLQSRWDIAEHLFFKLPLTSFITNREVVSEVAFNIGCDALSSSESETAIRWLERALEQMYILAAHQCQSGCPENLDLHIRHALGELHHLLQMVHGLIHCSTSLSTRKDPRGMG